MLVCYVTLYQGLLCMLCYFDTQNDCELARTGILSPFHRRKNWGLVKWIAQSESDMWSLTELKLKPLSFSICGVTSISRNSGQYSGDLKYHVVWILIRSTFFLIIIILMWKGQMTISQPIQAQFQLTYDSIPILLKTFMETSVRATLYIH